MHAQTMGMCGGVGDRCAILPSFVLAQTTYNKRVECSVYLVVMW